MSNYEKQAVAFLESTNSTMKIEYLKNDLHFSTDTEKRDIYKVTLKRDTKSFKFNFGQSINKTKSGEAPTAYDVLACLTKYDPESFEDFCSNYGYDTDSRNAKNIYKAVKKEYLNLCTLYTAQELEKLAEIQ